MLSINDFLYSFTYGIGIIKEIKDMKYFIHFQDKDIYLSPEEVNEVSPDLRGILKDRGFKDFFDYQTYKRGIAYYMEDRCSDIHIIGKNITGIVSGNEDYAVTVTLTKNTIRSRCSCPVGISCKHSVAVLAYVSEVFNDLEKSIGKENSNIENNNITIPNEFIRLLDRLDDSIEQSRIDIESIIKFRDLLKDKDYKFYNDLITYLNKHYRYKSHQMGYLKKLIVLNDNFYSEFNKINLDLKFSFFGKEIIRQREVLDNFINQIDRGYSIKKYDISLPILYYISNGYLKDLTDYILSRNNGRDYKNYLPYLFKLNRPTEDEINNYLDYLKYYNDIEEVTEAILDYLSIDEKIDFYIKHPDVKIKFNDLKEFPLLKQLDIILNLNINHENASYIKEKLYTFKSLDEKKAINIAFRLGRLYPRFLNDSIKFISESKDTSLVLSFLKWTKQKIDYSNLNIYDFLSYSYEIRDFNISYSITYYVSIGNCKLTLGQYENNKYDIFDIDRERNQILINKIEELEDFKLEIKTIKDKIYKRNYEAKLQEYRSDIKDFSSLILDNELILQEKSKMSIELSLYMTTIFGKDTYCVSFRVGNDKYYVVKDICEFLDAIRDGITLRYGKGLEFNHNIENFDSNSKKILEFFLQLPYNTYLKDSRKGLALSDMTINSMFLALKGLDLYFYDELYQIRLDCFIPEVLIDKDYILKSNLDKYLIIDSINLYLVDKDNKTIDKVVADNKLNHFYRFIYNHIGMDISIVKEDFMDSIYSRFYKYISLDESIKNDFLQSELKIHAYFDFEDGIINLRLSYFKGDIELLESEINSEADKSRIRILNNYLEALGFINNKIIDEDKIYYFFMMDFKRLKELCEIYLSESIKNKTIQRLDMPNIHINYNNSMMECFLSDTSYTEEELYSILSALKKKRKYVLLKDDRIIDLDNNESKEFYQTVNDLDLDIKHILKPKYSPLYQSFKVYNNKLINFKDNYIENMIEEITHFKESNIDIPLVNAGLRDYQKDGYKWLNILSKYNLGGILADDMGLGKTLEIITLLKGNDKLMPSLIVCPKSLIFNWISEILKFSNGLRVEKIYGSSIERRKIINQIPKDEKVIYITGYDSLRNDIDYYQGKIFNYVILDEAQAIKNVNAIKSQTVKMINGINKFALTGTPIENSIIDLWSIFDFLMPGYFKDLTEFKSKYEQDPNYIEVIKKKVAPFILRRTKEEVLKDLPSKYETIYSAEMETEQRKIYDAYIMDAKKKMEMGFQAFDMLPYLMRLRQICIDPKLFIENYSKESGKIKLVKEILNDYIPACHRMLLFSSFVSALELIEEYLINSDIKYLKITGDTKPEDRLNYVNTFNQDSSYKVFLISLKAGGTGLNLVGADTVIHLDPWWNLALENQATDRAYRIGQVRNVEVIKLVCEDSIEQKVIELQNMKKEVIDKVISNDDKSITGISKEDLRFILE